MWMSWVCACPREFLARLKTHAITDAKNGISTLIREIEKGEVLITRYGKPAAVVIGFHEEALTRMSATL